MKAANLVISMVLCCVCQSKADGPRKKVIVIQLPKGVPGWFSGSVKNLDDIRVGTTEATRTPAIVDPWATDMERELTRLIHFQRGHANRGRSELINPWPETDAQAIANDVQAFVQRFLPGASHRDQTRFSELLAAFLEGAARSREEGFDAMARIISQHTGRAQEPWALTRSPQIMQVLHDMGYWKDMSRRVVNAAESEYAFWTDTTDPQRRQRSESNNAAHRQIVDRLQDYWQSAGLNPVRAAARARRSTQDAPGAPWSAAFISHVMRVAGAGDTFVYDEAHSTYAEASKNNLRNNVTSVTQPSRLFNAQRSTDGQQPGEPVHVGGLIHRNRSGGTRNRTYANITAGNQSHADIVVGIRIFDAAGNRVAGDHEEIIRSTAPDVLQTYRIFAETIGGNTADQELGPNLEPRTRRRTGSVAGRDNETVGRRFWLLNSDLTVNNDVLPDNLKVYGIQRNVSPP